tara:strand:+ start:405 stop:854 length:450 start_codon:yes stop_codon:yes gene_type:complete
MSNKKYIKVDPETNRVLQVLKTAVQSLPEPWVDITGLSMPKVREFDALFYNVETGEFRTKEEVRLSVGSTLFLADGKDCVAISLRGDDLDDGEEVNISINGEIHVMTRKDDLVLYADEPGRFDVSVKDDKYFSIPRVKVIIAEEPEDDE